MAFSATTSASVFMNKLGQYHGPAKFEGFTSMVSCHGVKGTALCGLEECSSRKYFLHFTHGDSPFCVFLLSEQDGFSVPGHFHFHLHAYEFAIYSLVPFCRYCISGREVNGVYIYGGPESFSPWFFLRVSYSWTHPCFQLTNMEVRIELFESCKRECGRFHNMSR